MIGPQHHGEPSLGCLETASSRGRLSIKNGVHKSYTITPTIALDYSIRYLFYVIVDEVFSTVIFS